LAIDSGWTEAGWLHSDPYFNFLRKVQPEQWKAVEQKAFTTEEEYSRHLQLPSLRKEINTIALTDQQLRYKRAQTNNDSILAVMDRQINVADLTNLTRAKEIIRQYGWPKISQVGKDGQNNIWLIVQHADQDVLFQKEALHAMEKLKENLELNMENYAFLYDRVQCNLNYKQLYGTQVVWIGNGEASAFRPMEKEYLVDRRRKKIGLSPLKIYALAYGFSYSGITKQKSDWQNSDYRKRVQSLIDLAKNSYIQKDFQKTYDNYNEASTFLGGMSNVDNFEAAVIFSKIAAVENDQKYKSIALDFLDLLFLREAITRNKLQKEPAFSILQNEQRWRDIVEKLIN